MHLLHISITALLLLASTLIGSHSEKVIEHKIYCPEDMYGQEYLKFYSMTAFLTTWTTTSPNESITIPTTGGGYLYDVAWGDGTTSVNRTGNASHIYSTPGDYQISITGSFPRIYFNNTGDRLKIKSIDQWGAQLWGSMHKAFYGCNNILGLATDTPDLSFVNNMGWMFASCTIFNQNISSWNVSNVIDIRSLFSECNGFNQDIGSWDVSNVTNMSSMFRNSGFNQDISSWDVSNVTDMSELFRSSDFDNNVGAWDVSNVTNMQLMFAEMNFNQDIGSWDVSNVTNMGWMFSANELFNQDIGTWDVSNVTLMNDMFRTAGFNQDISSWDVSNVTDMSWMFAGSDFNQNINSWNVSNVSDMKWMFAINAAFDQSIGDWDISDPADMRDMFYNSALSTENYDQTLLGWAIQSPMDSTVFNAGDSQYCEGSEAKQTLIDSFEWIIMDNGLDLISLPNSYTNNAGNNLWEDPNNWSLGIIPNAIHIVIIPSGLTCILQDWIAPSNEEDGLCYTIEIEDGALFEVEDGATFRTAVPCNY